MSIDEVLLRLVEVIKTSPEFSKLKQAKTVINQNTDLKREIEEFSLSQKQLYSGKLSPKDAEFRSKQLSTKFENLSRIPEVKNYLNALNSFDQVMANINKRLNEFLEQSLK